MLSPRDRYQHDHMFRHLVDSLYVAIEAAQYTPTEIREAAMLAQIMYEEQRLRRVWLDRPYDRDRDQALPKDIIDFATQQMAQTIRGGK